MTRSLRLAAWATLAGLLALGCGQKGPLFLPKEEKPPAPIKDKKADKPKATPIPQASPSPQPAAEPDAASPDEDDAQDGYTPLSDDPTF